MSAAFDVSDVPLRGRYACVDLETTGADSERERIIEVGIVIVDDGSVIDEWVTLVDPETAIPERIQAFTGISNDMVSRAPTFALIADEVLERCRGAVFTAHNARFDHGFLMQECARVGRTFDVEVLCTVKLSRRLRREERLHNLDAVIERYALRCEARHRALPDARAVADFLIAASHVHGGTIVREQIDALLRPIALPSQLSPSLMQELPEAPGAFRFCSEQSTLYVGHASSLRSLVVSRLCNGPSSLRDQVTRVDWVPTAGEWSARLIEHGWRVQSAPTLQRRRSEDHEAFTIRLEPPGADAASGIAAFDVDRLQSSFGFFRTRRSARQLIEQRARQYHLCLRVLGCDDGQGSCLRHQTGECRGACIGKEPLALHYARSLMAFAGMNFASWDYSTRVALTDRSHASAGAYHVFDRWCYIGSADNDEALDELARCRTSLQFDFSIYKLTLEALQRQRLEVRAL